MRLINRSRPKLLKRPSISSRKWFLETQEFLGHARISTTADVYTHVDDKILEDGVEALAAAIWPGPIEVEGSNGIQ